MTIGDKIKIQRKRLGLTQTELGEKLGVKTNAVSKWECNRVEDIPTSKIKAMAALFEVPPSYLIDDDSLPSSAVPIDLTSRHRIPILGRIAAGLPLYAEQNIEGYTLTDLNGGAEYFALRVSGDSMNAARIEDGDIIIVRRHRHAHRIFACISRFYSGIGVVICTAHFIFHRRITGRKLVVCNIRYSAAVIYLGDI